jgi:hypothetical protein
MQVAGVNQLHESLFVQHFPTMFQASSPILVTHKMKMRVWSLNNYLNTFNVGMRH